MAEITALVLADNASTDRTFAVAHKNGYKAKWVYDNGSIMALRPIVSAELRPASNSVTRKANVSVTLPYQVTDGGISVTKYASVHINAIVPSDCPVATSDDLVAFASNLIGQSFFVEMTKDEIMPY